MRIIWRILQNIRWGLEHLSEDPEWCEEQIEEFFGQMLYLASYFRNLEYRKGIYTYYFRDQTSFSLEEDYSRDRILLKDAIQKFGLVVRARRL